MFLHAVGVPTVVVLYIDSLGEVIAIGIVAIEADGLSLGDSDCGT
jgi:hypothetical protein